VQPEFVQGDVTELPAAVGSYFRLLLHFGCFHDELTDEQRRAEVGAATRLAASPATLLMMAWARGRRGPLPRGASRADIAPRSSAWEIDVEVRMNTAGAPGYARRADPRFYRLRRG
jgi:hypothetical protein